MVTAQKHVVSMVFRSVSDCNGDTRISDYNWIRVAFTMITRKESHASGKLKPTDTLRRKRLRWINSTSRSLRNAAIAHVGECHHSRLSICLPRDSYREPGSAEKPSVAAVHRVITLTSPSSCCKLSDRAIWQTWRGKRPVNLCKDSAYCWPSIVDASVRYQDRSGGRCKASWQFSRTPQRLSQDDVCWALASGCASAVAGQRGNLASKKYSEAVVEADEHAEGASSLIGAATPIEDMTAAAIAALAAEGTRSRQGTPPTRRRRPHEHPLMDDHACDGLPLKGVAPIPAKSLYEWPFCQRTPFLSQRSLCTSWTMQNTPEYYQLLPNSFPCIHYYKIISNTAQYYNIISQYYIVWFNTI